MADHDIQKSQNLLKRLEKEMYFLTNVMDQANGMLDLAIFISSRVQITWVEIDKAQKSRGKDTERHKKKYFH